mmetsp:Transcript_51793/g.138197  ORF Transcript_51793/g.138197 Transcript_51793/m.138197 type:complete len:316 (-) Transcript_51793:37-984(-)
MAGCDRSFDLMPFLQVLVDVMEVQSICRFRLASSTLSGPVEALRSTVLGQRYKSPSWPWQKAHSIEAAALHDEITTLQPWTPGPNKRNMRNVLLRLHHALWASGGTDLQAFQGVYRTVSTEGVQSSWISVRVRVGTPDVSGAFLALYSSKRSWGFTNPVLVFNYKGQASEQQRCFSLQTEFGTTQERHVSHQLEPVEDRAYDVAIHLDWQGKTASMFIDGVLTVEAVPFQASHSIRYATIYNWRSAAFSDLTIGSVSPSVELLPAAKQFQGRAFDPCPRKLSRPSQSCWQKVAAGAATVIGAQKFGLHVISRSPA